MRLDKAVDRFVTWRAMERGASERSVDSYFRCLAKLCELYPDATLADFEGRAGTDRLRAFVAKHWARRSASTRGKNIAYLRSFFGWLEAEDLMETNPARKLKSPPKRRPEIQRPEESELILCRNATTVSERPGWLLMEGLGFRNEEARRARWRHADLNHGKIRVRRKGGDWQELPIPRDVLAALSGAYRELEPDPDDHMFVAEVVHFSVAGGLVRKRRDPTVEASSQALLRMVRRVCARAGVRRLYPHLLRHGCATRLYRRGVTKDEVQAFLGHRDSKSTEMYLDPIRLEQLGESIGRAFDDLNDPASVPPAQASADETTDFAAALEPLGGADGGGGNRTRVRVRPEVDPAGEPNPEPSPSSDSPSEGGH